MIYTKKNNFIDGAIISTLCLIVCKILGLIYVIPFYKIIGTKGGALYSYAYSIYAVFLNLSTIGIPSAIAKIISEYDANILSANLSRSSMGGALGSLTAEMVLETFNHDHIDKLKVAITEAGFEIVEI